VGTSGALVDVGAILSAAGVTGVASTSVRTGGVLTGSDGVAAVAQGTFVDVSAVIGHTGAGVTHIASARVRAIGDVGARGKIIADAIEQALVNIGTVDTITGPAGIAGAGE
jgi:hypothetical protein